MVNSFGKTGRRHYGTDFAGQRLDDNHDHLRRHLSDFIKAYNFGRRLKTLKGLTPYEFVCKQWTSEPQRLDIDPIHQMTGLNS